MRNGHDPERAALSHHQGCEPHGIVDHRRETAGATDDLHQTEISADLDDAAERIISIRLPQRCVESGRAQRADHGPEFRQVGADAEVEIVGLPQVVMSRERHGSDHDRVDLMPRQDGEDILRRLQKFVGIAQGRVGPGVGLSQA